MGSFNLNHQKARWIKKSKVVKIPIIPCDVERRQTRRDADGEWILQLLDSWVSHDFHLEFWAFAVGLLYLYSIYSEYTDVQYCTVLAVYSEVLLYSFYCKLRFLYFFM